MWIAIEGIDGAGKRTQATLLKERILRNGLSAAVVSFPRYGETVFARSIADYLNGRFGPLASVDPHFAALLYAGEREESHTYLLQTAEAVDILLLDRYTASNLAYQAARVPPGQRRAFITWLDEIEHVAFKLPRADHTIFLDLPVQTAAGLVSRKGPRDYTTERADLHEQDLAYLTACREVYHMLAREQFGSIWSTISCVSENGQLLPATAIHTALWQALAPALEEQTGIPLSRP